jgi:DNA invertase Pin-like site-specific DNA recombinase
VTEPVVGAALDPDQGKIVGGERAVAQDVALVRGQCEPPCPVLVAEEPPPRYPDPPFRWKGRYRRLSGKRTVTSHSRRVREPWRRHVKADKMIAGRENGRNRLASIGYARVSTQDQDPALQLDALRAAGCVRTFEDRASGARADRPGLRQALDHVRDGDVLVVWKLDRLGRSLPHLIETVSRLEQRGVGFRSITEAIDTTTSSGRLVFHLFGALGQFERDLIRERTRAGLDAAAARGRKGGRRAVVTAEKLERARAIIAKGLTVREAATRLKVGKTALYEALRAASA